MKTLHMPQMPHWQLHGHGHVIDNNAERIVTSAVMVPLLIVLLTALTMALQYFIIMHSHGHLPQPQNLPTFVDMPFAFWT